MKHFLLILLLVASRAAGTDPLSAEEVIRYQIDNVVYGTLKAFPDKEMTIRKTSEKKNESVFRYFRVEISPWQYVPELSLRFSQQERYIAYVNSDFWEQKDDYSSSPRFWGLRDHDIIGSVAMELPLLQSDGRLRELKERIDSKYEDKTLIRPISMDGVKDSLTAKVIKEEGQLFLEVHNRSEFRVWYEMIAAERLASKVDGYTFSIEGQRADGNWTWSVCGLSGSGIDKRFRIPVEIKPKASLKFPISVSRPEGYKRFRVRAVVYPSSELINGGDVFSEPFGLDQ